VISFPLFFFLFFPRRPLGESWNRVVLPPFPPLFFLRFRSTGELRSESPRGCPPFSSPSFPHGNEGKRPPRRNGTSLPFFFFQDGRRFHRMRNRRVHAFFPLFPFLPAGSRVARVLRQKDGAAAFLFPLFFPFLSIRTRTRIAVSFENKL